MVAAVGAHRGGGVPPLGSNARWLLERTAAARTYGALERNAAARTQGALERKAAARTHGVLEREWSHNRKSTMLLLMVQLQLFDHAQ